MDFMNSGMNTSLPVRTTIRRATPEKLARLNRDRSPETRFPPAEEAIDYLVRTPLNDFSLADLQRFSQHPDELVRIGFVRLSHSISHNTAAKKFANRHWTIWHDLVEQALQESNRDQVLWTPLLDACIDFANTNSFIYDTLITHSLHKRFDRFCEIVRAIEDPRALEPLAAFHSSAVRGLQLVFAQTIPEHLIPRWIGNAEHVRLVISNSTLLRKHGSTILMRIFELPTAELEAAENHLLLLIKKELPHDPAGWGDEVIRRAIENESYRHLAIVLHRLHGVSSQGLEYILDSLGPHLASPENDRVRELLTETVLHPACPREIRNRLLMGEFGFPPQLYVSLKTEEEILDAAWRHEGAKVATKVFCHSNVSTVTALRILRENYSALDFHNHPYYVPPCMLRPTILVALTEPSLGFVGKNDSLLSTVRVRKILQDITLRSENFNQDPWRDLALSLLFRNLGMQSMDAGHRLEVIEMFHKFAQSYPFSLDHEATMLYLGDSAPTVREAMLLMLSTVSIKQDLIKQDLPRWRTWAEKVLGANIDQLKMIR